MAAAALGDAASTSSGRAPVKEKTYDQHWQQPKRQETSTLKVWNSLTRTKVEFVPKKGKQVTWYNCGPTVYDASHMGHARNYVTQDFLRRIVRDYFGYNVHFVMNITDVDDKIIVRARHQHLFSTYLNETTVLSPDVLKSVQEAWDQYFEKFQKDISKPAPSYSAEPSTSSSPAPFLTWDSLQTKIKEDATWLQQIKESYEKFSMHLETLTASKSAIVQAQQDLDAGKTGHEAVVPLLEKSRDVISPWLDKLKGSSITDPAIFRSLAAYWEKSFFDDMERLHVERPTTMTRVSEYVPEIVEFVEKVIKNGYAYATEDGSVYFDTAQFDGAKGKEGANGSAAPENAHSWCHTYAKLQPWSKGNKELLEEGEGSLTTFKSKKSPSDFALWKASKPGEPEWASPWGNGRPGWHIECSVMASEVLGEQMDIHSGGVDLQFPHHDNEIAQSEAYHDCRQWVNYFLHTGHLHIEGLKMSKSLKNFITIEEALAKSTARQLRLAFLLQLWNARMDFKESNMHEVRTLETIFNNFFTNVRALVSDMESRQQESSGSHQYRQAEKDLMQVLKVAQADFHEALCDSFNTPEAVQTLSTLVSKTNVYVSSRSRQETSVEVLQVVSDWVTRMLRMLGLGEGAECDARGKRVIGWGQAAKEGTNGGADDREAVLMPYLRALSAFRDSVRKLARDGASNSDILALSDRLRDQEMVDLGVALDDQEDGQALVKLVPAEQLRAVRDEKAALAKKKADQKAAAQAAAEAKRQAQLEKGRLSPLAMFKQNPEYSKFDEDGIPTHDAKGEEVPKTRSKKLKKEWDAQKRLHDLFLAETKGQ